MFQTEITLRPLRPGALAAIQAKTKFHETACYVAIRLRFQFTLDCSERDENRLSQRLCIVDS